VFSLQLSTLCGIHTDVLVSLTNQVSILKATAV
jgi:hypothetical protein